MKYKKIAEERIRAEKAPVIHPLIHIEHFQLSAILHCNYGN
jgi:hypothetical protein